VLALFVALAADFAAGQDAIGGVSFGAGAVANLSDGPMFPIDVDSKDRSMDAAYAMDDIAYLKGQLTSFQDLDDGHRDPGASRSDEVLSRINKRVSGGSDRMATVEATLLSIVAVRGMARATWSLSRAA
jgi:hypothetical protein